MPKKYTSSTIDLSARDPDSELLLNNLEENTNILEKISESVDKDKNKSTGLTKDERPVENNIDKLINKFDGFLTELSKLFSSFFKTDDLFKGLKSESKAPGVNDIAISGGTKSSGGTSDNLIGSLLKNVLPEGMEEIAPLLEKLLPAIGLSEGGTTNTSMAIVGEGKDFNPEHTELLLNPTNAPIQVLNSQQAKASGFDITNPSGVSSNSATMAGFAGGTSNGTTYEIPRFASGTTTGNVLSSLSSGGSGLSGNDILGGLDQGFGALARMVPLVGDYFADLAVKLEYFGQVIIDVVQGFNKLANAIGPYSPAIVAGQAEIEVATIKQDISFANRYGDRLASLYVDSQSIWLDIKELLVSFSEPLLEILGPTTAGIRDLIRFLKPSLTLIADSLTLITGVIMRLFTLDLEKIIDYAIQKGIEMWKHLTSKNDENWPFNQMLLGAEGAAFYQPINIRPGGIP